MTGLTDRVSERKALDGLAGAAAFSATEVIPAVLARLLTSQT